MSNLLESLDLWSIWAFLAHVKTQKKSGALPDGFSQDSARGLACSSQNVTPSSQTTTLAARTILD